MRHAILHRNSRLLINFHAIIVSLTIILSADMCWTSFPSLRGKKLIICLAWINLFARWDVKMAFNCLQSLNWNLIYVLKEKNYFWSKIKIHSVLRLLCRQSTRFSGAIFCPLSPYGDEIPYFFWHSFFFLVETKTLRMYFST